MLHSSVVLLEECVSVNSIKTTLGTNSVFFAENPRHGRTDIWQSEFNPQIITCPNDLFETCHTRIIWMVPRVGSH